MIATERPILIYRLGSLGDTIVALPCFHAIARAFPGRARIALTNVPVSTKAAALQIILQPGGLIDGAIEYPVALRSLRALWRLRRTIRTTGADTLIYLAAGRGLAKVRRDIMFFHLCGIKTIIGAPHSADLHNNRIDPATGVEEPEVERLARTMAAIGPIDLTSPTAWTLCLSPAEQHVADIKLAPLRGAPFFAINLGGKVAVKDWGDAKWTALVDAMASRLPGWSLVAVGAVEDAARSGGVLSRWTGQTVNLCGKLAPRESAAVLSRARLFIGHDSGPLHLAAAAGTRTIGLFGDYNRPRKWHPYGVGHQVVHEMRGIGAIEVEPVVAAALGALE